MAAASLGDDLDVAIAFFKDADRCKVAFDAGDRIFGDRSAFIADHVWPDAFIGEPLYDLRCSIAADLFGTA